jgi:hypothetical protein
MSSADRSQQSIRRVNAGSTSSASREIRNMQRPARIPAVQADEAANARSANSSICGEDTNMDGPGEWEVRPESLASQRTTDLPLSGPIDSSETRNDGEYCFRFALHRRKRFNIDMYTDCEHDCVHLGLTRIPGATTRGPATRTMSISSLVAESARNAAGPSEHYPLFANRSGVSSPRKSSLS